MMIYHIRIKKGESQVENCHTRNVMHSEADKAFKNVAHHEPLRQSDAEV